jgi:hypothetical protein
VAFLFAYFIFRRLSTPRPNVQQVQGFHKDRQSKSDPDCLGKKLLERFERLERFKVYRVMKSLARPGSNRRRRAWEFSTEIDVFFFCSKYLVDLFRSSNVLLSFSSFN